MKAKIHVTLKSGILDPQGTTVGHALNAMGYDAIHDVSVGKFIEMNFNAFNLSRLQMEVEIIQEVEDTFWTIRNVAILAGAGGFVGGAVMFVFWARRPFSS